MEKWSKVWRICSIVQWISQSSQVCQGSDCRQVRCMQTESYWRNESVVPPTLQHRISWRRCDSWPQALHLRKAQSLGLWPIWTSCTPKVKQSLRHSYSFVSTIICLYSAPALFFPFSSRTIVYSASLFSSSLDSLLIHRRAVLVCQESHLVFINHLARSSIFQRMHFSLWSPRRDCDPKV